MKRLFTERHGEAKPRVAEVLDDATRTGLLTGDRRSLRGDHAIVAPQVSGAVQLACHLHPSGFSTS